MANRVYYHATTEANAYGIMFAEEIHVGQDGAIYLCDKPEDYLKFMVLRVPDTEPIYVFKIYIPDDVEVYESFDHNRTFFQCDAWYVNIPIPKAWCDDDILVYTVNGGDK